MVIAACRAGAGSHGCAQAQVYAVRGWRDEGELFDRYVDCACENGTRAVWDRHDLKGKHKRMFSQLLSDLDLHHPPCLALGANKVFYTLAALAYNVLTTPKLAEYAHRPPAHAARQALALCAGARALDVLSVWLAGLVAAVRHIFPQRR